MIAKLLVELVPRSCWYTNVRSNVLVSQWDLLRRHCYRKANYKCEICGGTGNEHPVECHELWRYYEGTQRLIGLQALCPACHAVKHFGLSQLNGNGAVSTLHLSQVNGWSKTFTEEYLRQCFVVWQIRSRQEWKLDISLLDDLLLESTKTQ